MTEREWNNLKDGDVIYNPVDGYMTVRWTDTFNFHYEKELNLEDDNDLWNGSQFNPADWEKVK